MARIQRPGTPRPQDSGRSLVHALAAYAICATWGGAGAGILGYGGLRLLQEKLGFPEVMPTLLATAGALGGCVAGFRFIPRGWFPGERALDASLAAERPARHARRRH